MLFTYGYSLHPHYGYSAGITSEQTALPGLWRGYCSSTSPGTASAKPNLDALAKLNHNNPYSSIQLNPTGRGSDSDHIHTIEHMLHGLQCAGYRLVTQNGVFAYTFSHHLFIVSFLPERVPEN